MATTHKMTSRGSVRSGTNRQHAKAGSQSHKNQTKKGSGSASRSGTRSSSGSQYSGSSGDKW